MTRTLYIAIGWVLLTATAAEATKISDVTHLKGRRTNTLVGFGLVVGLKGTGDGGKYPPAMRPLAAWLRRMANPVITADELKGSNNVAIAAVEATLGEFGGREGDRVDVKVSAVGPAKSLVGGRLMLCPLTGPAPDDPRVYALASGPLRTPDTTVPTTAVVRQGATLEADIIHNFVTDGKITFVIENAHASWAMANTIAQVINEETAPPGSDLRIARAASPVNVEVELPRAERAAPAGFIARLEALDLLMPATEARVKVNRTTGTIIITGDVEISPVAISHKGLTITAAPPAAQPAAPAPGMPAPAATPNAQEGFVGVDPHRQGGSKLSELLDALNQLKVPAEDRIVIIEELHKTGKLHAKLIVEN